MSNPRIPASQARGTARCPGGPLWPIGIPGEIGRGHVLRTQRARGGQRGTRGVVAKPELSAEYSGVPGVALLPQPAPRTRAVHRWLNRAGLFCRKASMPSRLSSVAKSAWKSLRSNNNPSDRGVSKARWIDSLAAMSEGRDRVLIS